MPAPAWKYAENTFESATENSWTLMNKVATDHLAKLTGKLGPKDAPDVDIAVCHARVTSAMAVFTEAWSGWQNLDATYGGKTDVLEALLGELSSKRIRQWDVAIQNVFPDDTPEYAEILPGRRAPFQGGAIEDRVQAVKTLGGRLTKFPKLAELATTVTAFHGSLKRAREAQKGQEGARNAISNDAETAREALAATLYANVGRLMEKHSTEPYRIEEYFDLSLIRQTGTAPVAADPPQETPASATVLGSHGPGSAATTTIATEVTPRTTSNGSREHSPA